MQIVGAVLRQAEAALVNASASFANSGVVQIGADFGSDRVSAALAGFASALSRATSDSGERASSQAQASRAAQESFAQCDARIAASASFAGGA